jgi:hypothetical protein
MGLPMTPRPMNPMVDISQVPVVSFSGQFGRRPADSVRSIRQLNIIRRCPFAHAQRQLW